MKNLKKGILFIIGWVFISNTIWALDISLPDTIRMSLTELRKRNPNPIKICFSNFNDTTYLLTSQYIHSFVTTDDSGLIVYDFSNFSVYDKDGTSLHIFGYSRNKRMPRYKKNEIYQNYHKGIIEITPVNNCVGFFLLFGQYYGYLKKGTYYLRYSYKFPANSFEKYITINKSVRDYIEMHNVNTAKIYRGQLVSKKCVLIIN
jgi:hypothetical protein